MQLPNPKRSYPTWVTLLIGLFMISIVKEVFFHKKPAPSTSPPDKWLDITKSIKKKGDETIKDPFIRHKWCDCVLAGLKENFPGGLDLYSQDTVYSESVKLGSNCIQSASDTTAFAK